MQQHIKQLARTVIPKSVRPWLTRQWTRWRHYGRHYECPVCGCGVDQFLPHGNPPAPDFLCPVCRSKPPHRLAAFYFREHPECFVKGEWLIHVAPEAEMRRRLVEATRRHGMLYRCGGITGHREEFLDLLDLDIPDQSVHLLYCCHVLNSLQDDRLAMREVHRVMHPDGVALLQVPAFYQGETTLETNSLEERMRVFHDEGIYRCYTDADYVARLNQAGFDVTHYWARDLGTQVVDRFQLKGEVLHVCRRRRETG